MKSSSSDFHVRGLRRRVCLVIGTGRFETTKWSHIQELTIIFRTMKLFLPVYSKSL